MFAETETHPTFPHFIKGGDLFSLDPFLRYNAYVNIIWQASLFLTFSGGAGTEWN